MTQVLTLDEVATQLNLSHIDWLKIDAEKSDNQILKGASNALSKIVKNIIFETQVPEEILPFLISKGFKIKKINPIYYLASSKGGILQ